MSKGYYGAGCLSSLETALVGAGASHVYVLVGSSFERTGAAPSVRRLPFAHRYSETTTPLPTEEEIDRVASEIKDQGYDAIVAIGGGRVIDIAKAAALVVENATTEHCLSASSLYPSRIPVIAVPTTVGTGSEVTPFSVVYRGKTKHSLAHPSMLPEISILDFDLAHSLPPEQVASTGCDALAQAIESYWSVQSTPESQREAGGAISSLLWNLKLGKKDEYARGLLMMAAHHAGKSIAIAKTTGAHALSYPLTAHFGISHGHAVMLTLPYFFPHIEEGDASTVQPGYDWEQAQRTFKALLGHMDVHSGSEAKDKLLNLMDDLGLERKLSNLGLKYADLDTVVREGFNPERMKNTPRTIGREWVRSVLEEVF